MKTFPVIHLIVLILGCIILILLKKKYPKIHNGELIIIFILLVILACIFSDTGIDIIKRFVNSIQID
jgi:energy-converting hydrogenase Eha subunit C